MISQWRRGIAARGVIAAALFALPVAVAVVIGFGGLGVGLSSLAAGPHEQPDVGSASRVDAGTVDRVSVQVASATAPGPGSVGGSESGPGSQSPEVPSGGLPSPGGSPTSPGGSPTSPNGGAGGGTGGGGGGTTIGAPVTDPGGDSLLDGINSMFGGLLGQ